LHGSRKAGIIFTSAEKHNYCLNGKVYKSRQAALKKGAGDQSLLAGSLCAAAFYLLAPIQLRPGAV
jgi:hypothetical protein